MNVIWKKIGRDLIGNIPRTVLVVLSTSVGIFALGLVFSLSDLMANRMTEDYKKSSPAQLQIWGGPFTQDVVVSVGNERGVDVVEGTANLSFRWKKEGENDWHNGNLIARNDYKNLRIDRVELTGGVWPQERNIAIERQSASYYHLTPGDNILIEFGHSQRALAITGLVRYSAVYPPQFGGSATFYTTPETAYWITGYKDYNQINITLDTYSEENAQRSAKQIKNRLERLGAHYGGYYMYDPNKHWMQDTLNTMMLILGVLGVLTLGVSSALIINTVNAIITQQIWQIGVMKVLGGTSRKVLVIYLVNAIFYGGIACILAAPASWFVAHRLSVWLLEMLNIQDLPFRIVPAAVLVQTTTGLLVPLLAAAIPASIGARITPQRAILSYGLGFDFKGSPMDQLIRKIEAVPRPIALSLRNVFRRKARLLLTLSTLVFGGLIFIVVMSLNSSMNITLERLLNELGLDIWVVFAQPERDGKLLQIAESVPGVARAEVWNQTSANLILGQGREKDIYLMALPPDSKIFKPDIVEGRGLVANEGNSILLNKKIATEENIHVMDKVKLKINGKESAWLVVGIILDISQNQESCYVPFSALGRATGVFNRGSLVMVQSQADDPAGENELIQSLREAYTNARIKPSFLMSAVDIRQQNRAQFNILTYLLLAMAILAGIVGCIGLTGSMAMNVVERSREIGVMRSIGATTKKIVAIFVVEGVAVGILSWFVAVLLGFPGAFLFSSVVGQALLAAPLTFRYSVVGVLLWLIIVATLSAIASIWPAIRASRISIQQSLSYE